MLERSTLMPEQAKSALVLHCGAREVTREELARVATPAATETWFPVSHDTCVATVQESLTAAGFEIRQMRFGLARNDARMFATVDLASPLATGVSLAVGIRNSLDKSLPLGFCAGSRTFVCDNLSFRSEMVAKRKHTRFGHERFGEAIIQAIKNLVQFRTHEAERIKRLQLADIDDRFAESLMLRAYQRQLVSHRALPGVIREWRSPSFEEFQDRTAWSLLQAFTTILADRQKSNPQVHAALTMRLGGLFDETLGIKPFVLVNGNGGPDHGAAA
jgi:Domain of unknown function (DUF932)